MKKIILPALLAFGCLTASQFAAADTAANLREHQRQMQHAGYCTQVYGNPSCINNSRGGGYDSDSGKIPGLDFSNLPPLNFAALAAAPNRVFATQTGYTASEARQKALERCRQQGGRNCRAIVTQNRCLLTAGGKDAHGDTYYFFGEGQHLIDAKHDALNQCRSGGYTECKAFDGLNHSVCAAPRR
ncbi:DUF4189 domain-containing protein [Eikenella sp. S3360]|uniref:DUF4189 domain-containing protein n=1 Tax=Eikenella glucosivorans TaxID=2766967 RepID=A0ABS0NBA3_9NEIS|nr:DUF4189 domain-containing protein [Eikenella glucosivorans]MBH5329580.1 DUF4189 domain-containing protein [Eikenella glucosivorans]